MRRVSVRAGCLCVLLAAACGSDDTAGAGGPVGGGGAGGSGNYATPTAQQLSDFADGWEAAWCGALAVCCAEAGLATGGTCFYSGIWDEAWPTDPARVGFDAAHAEQCVTGLDAALVETCPWDRLPAAVAASCARVFQGVVAPGGECAVSLECARSTGEIAFCEPSGPPPALGTCVVEAIPAEPPTCEATCRGDGSAGAPGDCACADGTYCEAASSTCQPRKAVGAPCSGAPNECIDYCDGATGLCAGLASALVCAGRP